MWLYEDKTPFSIVEELETGSDRVVAIVAGALIDSKLSDIVRAHLRRDESGYSAKIRKEMFHPDGPLGSYGAKSSWAYLMGFFSEDAHADLQTFGKVRNAFAHFSEQYSFDSERITKLCANFRLIKTHMMHDPRAFMADRDGKKTPADSMWSSAGEIKLYLRSGIETPKNKFVATAKLFMGAFQTNVSNCRVTHSPVI